MTASTGVGRGRGPSPQAQRRLRAARVEKELDRLTGALRGAAQMDWAASGACAGRGDDLFFPAGEPGGPMFERQVAEAKRQCAGCLVRTQCLEYALAAGEDDGVWGGLDDDERRALRRSRSRAGLVVPEASEEEAA